MTAMPGTYPLPPSQGGEDDELLTLDEVAVLLKMDRSTISRMIKGGELLSIRFGRSVRVMRKDLKRAIEQHRDI